MKTTLPTLRDLMRMKNVMPVVEQPRDNLYLLTFDLMKVLPAIFMLRAAQAAGEISKDAVILESSSGNFGVGLAIAASQLGMPMYLVSDTCIDPLVKARLDNLGCKVSIVTTPNPVGGFQSARLDRLQELTVEFPNHFLPRQYTNVMNPQSYSLLASYIVETLGKVDCLVGTVGSGGSLCGTSKYYKKINPDLEVHGVDTFGSVLFGLKDKHRLLRGLGNSLKVKNLNHSIIDQIHWVSAALAFNSTFQLHKTKGIFQGPTSGAAYHVAKWIADNHPAWKVAAICPDRGDRYYDTVYRKDWLDQNNLFLPQLPLEPTEVQHPLEAQPHWSVFRWGRRTYEQVLGVPYVDEVLK